MKRLSRQAGFSLLELLLASFLGFAAMVGVLYLYKSQHRNMTIQKGISEMRMNAQFCLNEAQYQLGHAGLGLPSGLKYLLLSQGDIVIRMNTTKKSASADMRAGSTRTKVVYGIARSDTSLFSGKAYVAAITSGGTVEAAILDVAPASGELTRSLITLAGDMEAFPASARLYPLEKVRLHRCTGAGADTAEGDFRILQENPRLRRGLAQDTLTLAEGIESLTYRFFLLNGSIRSVLPSSLDSLERVEVSVAAMSPVLDREAAGDGYKRDTLAAKVAYRRSF